MARASKSEAHPPDSRSLKILATASKGCTACELYRCGTQTVFGEGKKTARLLIVGEQPGDQEDLEGRPFIGPAGKLLDEVLDRAGIPRTEVYVTNAVKHFKWVRSGKRRLHQKPNAAEVHACRPWLESEIRAIDPVVIICLGATAAQSVFGKSVTLSTYRTRLIDDLPGLDASVVVSWHPSSILRAPTPEARAERKEQLFHDLALAWRATRRKARPERPSESSRVRI